MKTKFFTIIMLASFIALSAPQAWAQEGAAQEPPQDPTLNKGAVVDILPAKSLAGTDMAIDEDNDTHPPIRLTPDKSELIRLDQEAGSVIVGSPDHISVLADSAKTLVLVPRIPGATYITVLNHHGDVLMQRHVIVASPKEKYVRIRRTCAAADGADCQSTRVYYCPDMCHEISLTKGEAGGGGGSIESKIKDVVKDINKAADEGDKESQEKSGEDSSSEGTTEE